MTLQERRAKGASARHAGPRSGGRILVDQLLVHGADMAFCVPGESYLNVLDALYDVKERIALVNARHEAGAANMAEAYGKLTGRPGIAMVTRGPGACHAAVGVHTARQDSTPMILLVGQVGRGMIDREAFQEVDFRQMFGPVAKWAAEIDVTARIPEYLARAFHLATSGRPGPVVLALPEDMLVEAAEVADAAPYVRSQPAATPQHIDALRSLLAEAERPLMFVGGSGWSDDACRQIVAFAEVNGLPTGCSFRRQDIFDNRSDCYIGDLSTSISPALSRRVKDADLLLLVGARLGEIATQGYTLLQTPDPHQRLVHVYPDPDEIGRIFTPALAIPSNADSFAAAATKMKPLLGDPWRTWREAARKEFLESVEPPPTRWPLDLGRAFTDLQHALPRDFIVTIDAGNFSGWVHRFFTFARPARELGPISGSMGYAVPAAIAASLMHKDRVVIGCVGDGGFMMTALELATAVQHGGRPIILVFNNSMYGTIRMHQEREHPERVHGTDLVNPDFAVLARALGAHGEVVVRTDEFGPAFERARKSGKPAVIELRTDPEQVSTRTTIAALRVSARRK
jgi:acetolactate synthase-1/2/3 large subunit